MARTVDIISPVEQTSELVGELRRLPGLISLRTVPGSSVTPPGDVVTATVPDARLQELMRLLDGHDLGRPGGLSLASSTPDSVIAPSLGLERDSIEASWEEMHMILSKDGNATGSTLLLMGLAGALATSGIATSSLHIVIGGMLIAPGFMPIIRVPLGLVAHSRIWRRGVLDVLQTYGVLIVSSGVTGSLLRGLGYDPLRAGTTYYAMADPFVTYWTMSTAPGILSSALASVAGAVLLATQRSIFTSGVMIGLALVPSAALVGVAAAAGNLEVAQAALSRFAVDVALVLSLPWLYFLWVRRRRHGRQMR